MLGLDALAFLIGGGGGESNYWVFLIIKYRLKTMPFVILAFLLDGYIPINSYINCTMLR